MKQYIAICAIALTTLAPIDRSRGAVPGGRNTFRVTGAIKITGATEIPSDISVRLTDSVSFAQEVRADPKNQFQFVNIPQGRYSLTVIAPGFVGLPHGARYAGALEVPVTIDSDSAGLSLELVRTATISGMVRDRFNAPAVSAAVLAKRWSVVKGWRVLEQAGAGAKTDVFGRYRLTDLAPGSYVVSVVPESLSSQIGAKDVYVETFYPGTFDPANAVAVPLGPGDMANIDIDISLIRTFVVRGRIIVPAGAEARRMIVWAWPKTGLGTPSAGAEVSGTAFQVQSLIPGEYVVEARVLAGIGSGAGTEWNHWGRTEFTISGLDIADIEIVLRPTLTLSGHLTLDGPGCLTRAATNRITLLDASRAFLFDMPTALRRSDSEFAFGNVAPGSYWLDAGVASSCSMRSVRDEAGNDLTYRPITATDRLHLIAEYGSDLSSVHGTVTDGTGKPTSELAVALLPADARRWTLPEPAIRALRPDTKGSYAFEGLAEGDYLLSLFEDSEAGLLTDLEFIRRLSRGAISVAIPKNARVDRNLRAVAAR